MNIDKKFEMGPLVLSPNFFPDKRGSFMVPFNRQELEKVTGIEWIVAQINQSTSAVGVIRGGHCQIAGEKDSSSTVQPKLVRVLAGKIVDVALDLRANSPTYGQYVEEVLSAENRKMLYIPAGFAHAFLAIEESTIEYVTPGVYDVTKERGVNAFSFGFPWEQYIDTRNILMSEKDMKLPDFKDLRKGDLKFE